MGVPFSLLMSPTLPPDLPDSQLIATFQSGDLSVFNLLYHRHYDRIHGVILSVIYNPEDALDITQEVFLKAYQGLESFNRASKFYSWLYRIAINRCIDHMRRQSKHRVLIDAPFCEATFHDDLVHPSAALERAEFHRQLRAALPALTPSQRRVFVLRYKEDLPLKAIAHQLGRSIGTVKAHLFHARRTLHDQLLSYFQCEL